MSGHRIFPHGALTELTAGLWQVEGSLPFPLKRNMTVYRQPDGSLVIYSAVALDDAGLKSLEALGEPSLLVVSHPMHTMDAPFYKARYPRMRVVAPKDAVSHLGGVTIDGTPDELLPDVKLRHHVVPGMKFSEVVLDLEIPGGCALVFTDLVGFGKAPGLLMSLLGPPGGVGVARIVKWRQISTKPEVRSFLTAMAETPGLRIVAASHGPPALEGAADKLRIAAAGL